MSPVNTLLASYIEAVYFTETGDTDQPPATAELTDLFKADAYFTCRRFHQTVTQELDVPEAQVDWARAGHDLWLTRNGHGTGFWDRPEVYGDALAQMFCALATAMGEHDATFKEQP